MRAASLALAAALCTLVDDIDDPGFDGVGFVVVFTPDAGDAADALDEVSTGHGEDEGVEPRAVKALLDELVRGDDDAGVVWGCGRGGLVASEHEVDLCGGGRAGGDGVCEVLCVLAAEGEDQDAAAGVDEAAFDDAGDALVAVGVGGDAGVEVEQVVAGAEAVALVVVGLEDLDVGVGRGDLVGDAPDAPEDVVCKAVDAGRGCGEGEGVAAVELGQAVLEGLAGQVVCLVDDEEAVV